MAELSITLTSDEALVLYDFLQRYEKSDILSVTDQAEQRALWNLLCVLDKELLEPLQETTKTRLGNLVTVSATKKQTANQARLVGRVSTRLLRIAPPSGAFATAG